MIIIAARHPPPPPPFIVVVSALAIILALSAGGGGGVVLFAEAAKKKKKGGGWYPDYTKDFIDGVCINKPKARNGVVTYETQHRCCEASYMGQSSGACVAQLPPGEAQAPMKKDGGWYPDYTKDFIDGVCVNVPDAPAGVVTYETQRVCCESSYAGQSSGACYADSSDSDSDSDNDGDSGGCSGGEEGADDGCYSADIAFALALEDAENDTADVAFALAEGDDADVADVAHSLEADIAYALEDAEDDTADIAFAVAEGDDADAGEDDVWFPDYSRGWNEGTCVSGAKRNGVVSYPTQVECCTSSYAGQASGSCFADIPDDVIAGMDVVWYPIYDDGNCASAPLRAPTHGIPGYPTQLACCKAEYKHSLELCLESLPFPPTTMPTTEDGGGSGGWYPDYSKGWDLGLCINRPPAVPGVVTYDSSLECCEASYAGQASGSCLADLPDDILAILPSYWYPDYGEGGCVESKAQKSGVRGHDTRLDCCKTEFAHDVVGCYPDAPSDGSVVWHPDYSKGWEQGVCIAALSVTNGIVSFATQEECCQNSYAGQASGECLADALSDDPEPIETPPPSPPPQDLSRRVLAEQIDRMLNPARREESLANYNDRNMLRAALEEAFGNSAGDAVDDISLLMDDDPNDVINADSASLAYSSGVRRQLSVVGAATAADEVHPGGLIVPEFARGAADQFLRDDDALPRCKCVHCKQDRVCGGLWKGEVLVANPDADDEEDVLDITGSLKVHIAVSHCLGDLRRVSDYIGDHGIAFVASVHVMSVCGDDGAVGAPVATGNNATSSFEVLPSVAGDNGDRAHARAYAHYIATVLPQRVGPGEEGDSVAVFLRDDVDDGIALAGGAAKSGSQRDDGRRSNGFGDLVRGAAGERRFRCGVDPGNLDFGRHRFELSAYHETEALRSLTADDVQYSGYAEEGEYYAGDDSTENSSELESLGTWWDDIGAMKEPQEAVPVCYGGIFSASVDNINGNDPSVWRNIETSLSSGNSSWESIYAERSWAALMSTPLRPYQLEALLAKADGVSDRNSYHGALLRRPKLFIHIGAEGTMSTELLTESLIDAIRLLELDGYRVAVHGKSEGGAYGFPDIDRLGSCLWDDMSKSLFPAYMKEAVQCNDQLLSDLSGYMQNIFEESHDMILLNPWLVRPGSAEPLSIYLDPVWDVSIVIYYRRFFNWILFKFVGWRRDLFKNSLSPDKTKIPSSSFRYIDFIREYCKRLFYGKDVNEDGFPVRQLHRYSNGHEKKTGFSESDFDPDTNFDLVELTDLVEYPYFAAKQYHAQARFRHGIKIVNSHDTLGVETNFYCHVLQAVNSCDYAVREDARTKEAYDVDHEAPSQSDTTDGLTPSIAIEDIVIKAYLSGRLSFDPSQPRKKFASQLLLWMEMVSLAMNDKNITIIQLPTECLFKYEQRRLLEASLAYEKAMLPAFYASPKGASNLKTEFEEHSFCSVDTDAILTEPSWDFLFDAVSNFTIANKRKAFIQIGDTQLGGAVIEKAMVADNSILKEDKYFVFGEYGHLAPCVWSDALRLIGGKAGEYTTKVCHDYLLPQFHEFLSNATIANSDVVISDEWLSMPSSEVGLVNVLKDDFDPVVVIYYRHFFDWIISSYSEWLRDVDVATLEAMRGNTRLVDFIRLLCSHLFEAEVNHSGERLVDIADFPEYTYQLWKQYSELPAYEGNIKVVNMHDGHIAKSFYCKVLNAEKTCKLESNRLERSEPAEYLAESLVPKYVEIAMGLNWKAGLHSNEQANKLGVKYEDRMTQRGMSEDDLPKECLSQAETSMLLMISLEYQRKLLPDHYSMGKGEDLKQRFATLVADDAFCSVDLMTLMDSVKWQFLFEPFDETGILEVRL